VPLYILKCPECGLEEEVLCSVDERTKQVCEKCKRVMQLMPSKCGVKWNCDTGTSSKGRECD